MYACMYVCMHAGMYVCMYACMYACMGSMISSRCMRRYVSVYTECVLLLQNAFSYHRMRSLTGFYPGACVDMYLWTCVCACIIYACMHAYPFFCLYKWMYASINGCIIYACMQAYPFFMCLLGILLSHTLFIGSRV